jgi:hypothetical protein
MMQQQPYYDYPPAPPGQRLVVRADGSYYFTPARKFSTGWYYLALLGPVAWFALVVMASFWETNSTGKLVARVILAALVVLWVIGVIAMALK